MQPPTLFQIQLVNMKTLKTMTRQGFEEPLEVEIFEHLPGEDDILTLPGDLLFTYRSGRLISLLIAWATECKISHVATVVDEGGYIAEALSFGLECEHISKYRYQHFYYVIRLSEGAEKVAQIAKKETFQEERPRYGYGTIFSLFLSSVYQKLFRRRYSGMRVFGSADRLICSAFAARCLEAAGYENMDYYYISPCELAFHLGMPEKVFDKGHLY